MPGEIKALNAGTLTFSYREPLKRRWTHEILNFDVRIPKQDCDLSSLNVTDETGAVVPAQFSGFTDHREYKEIRATVTVAADFEPWQRRTWNIHYDSGQRPKPEPPKSDLTLTEGPDGAVIANSKIAVKVGVGKKRFERPVDACDVPAPILALRGLSGNWIGRGWLESPQRVIGYNIEVTHKGPIFYRVRCDYNFEGGRYTCFVTLRTGEDAVHIREEFDLGEPSPLRNSNFCFSFYDGLHPNTVRWAGRYDDKRLAPNDPVCDYSKQQEAVFPIDYENPRQLLRLHGLFVWWSEGAGYFSIYDKDDMNGDFIGVFPERPGHWSNPTVIFLESAEGPDLLIKAPIRQPEQNWIVDGVDYKSPYYNGSVAPGTRRSYGAREWGILLTTPAMAIAPNDDINNGAVRLAQTRYGQNPLDKIKDWVLEWPDDGSCSYPRGYITRDELPALRERAAKSPALKSMLNDIRKRPFAYLVKQDPALGDELFHADFDPTKNFGAPSDDAGLLTYLRWSAGRYLDAEGDLGMHTCMHHGNYNLVSIAPLFDAAMGVPGMTPEERKEAKALYAFLIYKLSDPDWLAYGTGFHLGTSNMPTMSLSVIGASAALIPEHPMAYDWMMRSAKNIIDMLRDFTAPGGAWRECPHYQMDASLAGVIQSATVFKNAGFIDLFRNDHLKAAMLYHARLLTPTDKRLGIRTMPAIGNGSHEPTSLYGRMAAGTASSDPEYSSWMQWAWKAVGSQYWYAHDELNCNEELPARAPDMSSRHFPGFGAVMRSHFSEPDETYLIFRMGYQHEHYENDQGEIVLYAKGAPLALDFGSQYDPLMLRPWMHNRISLNHKLDESAQGEIHEAEFLDSADSCLGRMTITKLESCPDDPKDRPLPNQPMPEQTISPVIWTRQVMLVKNEEATGPHYVVMRDGFDGDGDDFSEFNLWCLAEGVTTMENTAHYTGQHGADLTVTVLDPPEPAFETGEYGHAFISNNMRESFNRTNGSDAKWEEVQHFIRLKRTDHGGYFTVLYPHRPEEAVPSFGVWAGGAGATALVNGERHVAICAEKPGIYEDAGICLKGRRALVRQNDSRLVMTLLSGSSLKTSGFELECSGPVSIAIDGPMIDVESNLRENGTVRISLSDGISLSGAPALTGEIGGKPTVSACKGQISISVPGGKCRFKLRLG